MSKVISLWSGPRNISTTMMYSFAQRNDTKVIDEPLYAHYLSKTDAKFYHPGADEVLKEQNHDGNKVLEEILEQTEYSNYFLKNMSHHWLKIDWKWMQNMKHILLIRDPKEVLLSYSKVIETIEITDLGYSQQWQMKSELEQHQIPFLVIDAKRVLQHPKKQLKSICEFLGLEFQPTMLYWEQGAIEEDGSWAKYWYNSIHQSTGFKAYQEKNEQLPTQYVALYEKCKQFYDKMLNIAVQ